MATVVSPSTIELLNKYFNIKNLSEETMKKLASICERPVFEAGSILYREHEQSTHLSIVHSGQIDIQYLMPNGRRKTLDTLLEGDFMLWSAVVPPHKTNSIGICRARAELLAIDGPKLRELCEADPSFGYQFMCQIAVVLRRRVQAARQQLVDLEG